MSTVEPLSIAPHEQAQQQTADNPLMPLLEKQRKAFLDRGISSAEERIQALEVLNKAIGEYADELVKAVQADFGHRSPHETVMTEALSVMGEIRIVKGKIKSWMKPKTAPFSIMAGAATGKILYQPKGVVGVMGAWNYPVALVFSPAIEAIAAGNHIMIKPPDVTPRTAQVVAELVDKHFDAGFMTVVTGDVNVAIQFSELPFDHLIYTGNTEVGRKVMMAAARNLTPVTLEMGGKSPTIIGEDYPIKTAVQRILLGKTVNSGQTCIAPDYVLIPKGKQQEFVNEYTQAISRRYPTLADNQDITWIVNERHYRRIQGLIEDARSKGANIVQINPRNEQIPAGKRIIPHTLITNVTEDMAVMHEEIFGPVLPVREYNSLEEAIRYVQERPRPLALYYFDNDRGRADYVISQTISGGATVNDTMLHIAHMNLPFGGVGPSGIGAYHGFDGFVEFSHKKGVLYQSRWFSPAAFVGKPYPKAALSVLQRAVKWLG